MTRSVHYQLFFLETDDNPDNVKDKVIRLPKSLAESVEALEKDVVIRDFIGEKLLTAIKGVRKVVTLTTLISVKILKLHIKFFFYHV